VCADVCVCLCVKMCVCVCACVRVHACVYVYVCVCESVMCLCCVCSRCGHPLPLPYTHSHGGMCVSHKTSIIFLIIFYAWGNMCVARECVCHFHTQRFAPYLRLAPRTHARHTQKHPHTSPLTLATTELVARPVLRRLVSIMQHTSTRCHTQQHPTTSLYTLQYPAM